MQQILPRAPTAVLAAVSCDLSQTAAGLRRQRIQAFGVGGVLGVGAVLPQEGDARVEMLRRALRWDAVADRVVFACMHDGQH